MEGDKSQKYSKTMDKDKKPKDKITYISLTHEGVRKTIVEKINAVIERCNKENGDNMGLIYSDTVPDVTYWVDVEKGRAGITLKKSESKWGFQVYCDFENKTAVWKCARYLEERGYNQLEFNDDENAYLNKELVMNCKKNSFIQKIDALLNISN